MIKVLNKTNATKGVLVVNDKGVRSTVPVGAGGEVILKRGQSIYDDHPVMQHWLDEGHIEVKEGDDAPEADSGEEGTERPPRSRRRR